MRLDCGEVCTGEFVSIDAMPLWDSDGRNKEQGS